MSWAIPPYIIGMAEMRSGRFLPWGFAWIAAAGAAPVITESPGKISIALDSGPFTEYVFEGYHYPYLYPVLGAGGVAMTRNYPMDKSVSGEPTDHDHHRSLWFAHSDVNGVDFWEGPGTIALDSLLEAEVRGQTAVLALRNRWEGTAIECTETRTLTFFEKNGSRGIEFSILLQAAQGEVVLSDAKEAGMAIRTRTELMLNKGGQALNAEGVSSRENTGAVWGKRAKWIDYWGQVGGKTLGVAVFDHPGNPQHPTTWHAREYGLLAANPFGLSSFEGGDGTMTIAAGDSLRFSYLFWFHEGDAQEAGLEDAYTAWTADALIPTSITRELRVREKFPNSNGRLGMGFFRIHAMFPEGRGIRLINGTRLRSSRAWGLNAPAQNQDVVNTKKR